MKNLFLSLFCFFLFATICRAQDTSFVKSAYGGSFLVVPKDVNWKIEKAFISEGDAYSIKISNSNFKESYSGGDTIRVPYYIAEMELLSGDKMGLYFLYIRQKK